MRIKIGSLIKVVILTFIVIISIYYKYITTWSNSTRQITQDPANRMDILTVLNMEEFQNANVFVSQLVRTPGFHNINDGGSSFFFIRQKPTVGSENESKVVTLRNGIVAEMLLEETINVKQFGAFGDGIHDDTKAIQSAIDAATSKVTFPCGKYKSGQININKNITIDCQGSSFIATEGRLFHACGKITKIIEGGASYSSNQVDYTIADGYSGFGKILGTNNFEPQRTYYRGGMVTWFNNGVIVDPIPVDVTKPTISEITPVSCVIKNINGVTFTNTPDGVVVFIQYGVKCFVSNIKINTGVYSIVYIKDCNNCEISEIIANLPEYKGKKKYIYPICIVTSCSTRVHDCVIDNPFWHCLSAGGSEGVCLNTLIQNCMFTSKTQLSICDHGNCIGTRIENCKCSGIGVGPGSHVRDCVIIPLRDSRKRCLLLLLATSVKDLAFYSVEDITFLPSQDSKMCGLFLSGFAQTQNNVGYFKNVILHNISLDKIPDNEQDMLGFSGLKKFSFSNVKLGNIIVDSCELQCLLTEGSRSNLDTSNLGITYKNCKTMRGNGKAINIALPTGGSVTINDSFVDTIIESGTPNDLILNNVVFNNNAKIKASGQLTGSNIWAKQELDLQETNGILLANVRIGSKWYDKIWRVDSEQDVHGIVAGNNEEIIIPKSRIMF